MKSISFEHGENVYWLGRYSERCFITLKSLERLYLREEIPTDALAYLQLALDKLSEAGKSPRGLVVTVMPVEDIIYSYAAIRRVFRKIPRIFVMQGIFRSLRR